MARSQGTTVEVKVVLQHPGAAQVPQTDATSWATALRRCAAMPWPKRRCRLCHLVRRQARPGQWRRYEGAQALDQRLADVLGADFSAAICRRGLVPGPGAGRGQCKRARLGWSVCPDTARSRADQQFCYVNGRFVREKVLTHATYSMAKTCCAGTTNRSTPYTCS